MAINKRLIKSNDEGGGGAASFNTVLYSGNSSTQSVTGVGFQPDMVWIKSRNISGANHVLTDSVRGTGKFILPNLTDGEYTDAGGTLSSFDADGFSLSSPPPFYDFNVSANNYVAWCWKAGGAAVTNTDGSITSQVSANTEAGFSVVTGSVPSSGFTNTYGHGLNDTPKIVISKVRNNASNWVVSNSFLANNCLRLNTTDAAFSDSGFAQTSTTIKTAYTSSAFDFVAYCFAEVAGFSKFGSYDGSTTTPTIIDCGFEPAFVMIKSTNFSQSWCMFDNKRGNTSGGASPAILFADSNAAEYNDNNSDLYMTFSDTGFQPATALSSVNGTGRSFIYMAFANQF